MLSKHGSVIAFLLVSGAHLAGFAALLMAEPNPAPAKLVQPTIQGVIVVAEAPAAEPAPPAAIAPPPAEPQPAPPKPVAKPKSTPQPKPAPQPVPKAPASERAVKAAEPEAATVAAEPAPVASAPVAAPVVPPRADAEQVNNPAPSYPSLSRRLREEGLVLLEILILADGSVGEIKLKQSSGFKRLDEAAMQAVKTWRYQPATQGGQAIDYWYEQPLEFSLN